MPVSLDSMIIIKVLKIASLVLQIVKSAVLKIYVLYVMKIKTEY